MDTFFQFYMITIAYRFVSHLHHIEPGSPED